jgi:hypothetical protein
MRGFAPASQHGTIETYAAGPVGLKQRRVRMNLDTVAAVLKRAFTRDIEDGTLEVRQEADAVVVDGGNWRLTAGADGTVGLDLPMNDANYYDADTDAFIENVLNTEVEESLAVADRELDGALSAGLLQAVEGWSVRLGERLAQARV